MESPIRPSDFLLADIGDTERLKKCLWNSVQRYFFLKFSWTSVQIYFLNSHEIRNKYTFPKFFVKLGTNVLFQIFYKIRFKCTFFQFLWNSVHIYLFKCLWNSVKKNAIFYIFIKFGTNVFFSSNFYKIRYKSLLFKFLWNSVQLHFLNFYEIRNKYTYQNFLWSLAQMYFFKFFI